MTEEISGTGLTPFCAIGRLHFYSPSATVSAPPKKCGESRDFTLELSRLEIAAEEARGSLEAQEYSRGDLTEIFDRIYERSRFEIFGGAGAREAVTRASRSLFSELSGGLDPYVSHLSVLCAEISGQICGRLSDGGGDCIKELSPLILIADKIDAWELEALDRGMLLGLILPGDTPLSAPARAAHSFGIPLIVDCEKEKLTPELEGKTALIDGEKGVIITDPSEDTVENYAMRLGELSIRSARKKDGSIRRLAVIKHEFELESEIIDEADGIGLLCTEGEGSDQLISYIPSVAERMGGREVRVLLPDDESKKSAALEGVLRAREHGRISVALRSVMSASSVQRLRCELLSLDAIGAEGIGICAVVGSGAALMMCNEIAEASDAVLLDCDLLMISLLSPTRAPTAEEIKAGEESLLRAIAIVGDACRKAGIPLGASGTLVTKKSIRERLSAQGVNELVLPMPYLNL